MTEDQSAESANESEEQVRVSQGRSPAYPYVSLKRAIERTEKVRDAGAARTAMPPEVFYKIWGIGAKSSGARQTMAALNHFGLVDYVGRGDDRKVELTDLARRIVLDKQPDSDERQKAIESAALTPPIHRELWKRFEGGLLPDDVVIETYLVRDRSFNEQAAKSLIKEYRDTLSFAGLNQPVIMHDEDGEDEYEQPEKDISVGDFVQWISNGVEQFNEPQPVTGISDDASFAFVPISETGLPVMELDKVDPPADKQPPPNPAFQVAGVVLSNPGTELVENDIKVLLDGDHLKVSAYVDRAGLKRLKKILDANAPLLEDEDDEADD